MPLDLAGSFAARFQIPESMLAESGLIENFQHRHIHGHNPATSTSEETVWDGSASFNYKTSATKINLSSSDAKETDWAVGILTLAANAADGDTVTIDTKVYTFETSLTDVDGNVLIGVAATNSIDNLIAAIMLGSGSGTLYAASTTEHPTVTAAVGAGDTMGVTAKAPGIEVATTETGDDLSWGTATTLRGVGLRTLKISGLDANYDEISETISLNGTAAVATALDYIRVFILKGMTAGSEEDNAGAVYASTGALTAGVPDEATEIFAKMIAGENKTHAAVYTVPNGWVAYLTGVSFNTATTGVQHVACALGIRPLGGVFTKEDRIFVSRDGGKEDLSHEDSAEPFPAKTDMELRGTASAATPELTGVMTMYLVKDPNINTGA